MDRNDLESSIYISYDGIEFKVLRVTDYVRQAVFTDDWTSYLFDHVSIRMLCWLSPAAMNQIVNVPIEIKEETLRIKDFGGPAATEIMLVERLLVPRKQLAIWMTSDPEDSDTKQYMIVSPFPGRFTDARFGPQCKVHALRPDHANASLVADLQFETDINPIETTVGKSGSPPIVLANRWNYRVSYDPNNYSEIRIIEGEAHVRMDTLLSAKFNPVGYLADEMRGHLVPPIPKGYQRENPTFELSSGGDVVRYAVIDRQTPMSFPLGSKLQIAHMKVLETRRYVSKLLLEPREKDVLTAALIGALPGLLLMNPVLAAAGAVGLGTAEALRK